MWNKIKMFFASIGTLDHTTTAVEILTEGEQMLEASQVISNISRSSNNEIESIIEIDDRLIITGLVFSIFSYALKLIKYIRQPSKNVTNTAGIIAKSILLGTNCLLGLAWLSCIILSPALLIIASAISLTADTFYNFIETIKYTYLTITATSREEEHVFAPKILYHIKGTALAGILGVAATLLTFDFPIVGGITAAATIVTAIAAAISVIPFIKCLFSLSKKGVNCIKQQLTKKSGKENDVQIRIKKKVNLQPCYQKQLLLFNYHLALADERKKTNDYTFGHQYYKNTISIARPFQEIEEDIHAHINKLFYLSQQDSSFIDRKQAEKRKEKISGLYMLLMFIKQITLEQIEQETQPIPVKKINFSFNYLDVIGTTGKIMTVRIEQMDLTSQKGRQHCFSEVKRKMQYQYPAIFNQFSFTTKHGYVRKLFAEVEAFITQPTLGEIKMAIIEAKEEAEQWFSASLFDKANPCSNTAFTLRKRTPPAAFQFLEKVLAATASNQLDTFVSHLFPSKIQSISNVKDVFTQIEEKLREDYQTTASFDMFKEGKLATLFNHIREYHLRYNHSSYEDYSLNNQQALAPDK